MNLRPASESDLPRLIELAGRSWLSGFASTAPAVFVSDWQARGFEREWYPRYWRDMTVAEIDGTPVGVVQPMQDEYAPDAYLTADGIHLIRPGPWAWLRNDKSPDFDCEAVSFFANGQMLRTYRVGELVDSKYRFERSVSHYDWQKEGRVSGEFEYTITTLDGNRYAFDIRTGEVVFMSRESQISQRGGWLALGLAVAAGAVWFAWQRRRRKTKGDRLHYRVSA